MFILSLLLPLACCAGAAQGVLPPMLDVGSEVVVLTKETKQLKLRCEGTKELYWNWTSTLPTDAAAIKSDFQNNNERRFVSTLEVDDPLVADTGFYRCYYANATNMVTDKDNVDSTYVYIHDETTTFVEDIGHSSQIVRTDEKLELDCRTTLPSTTVTLSKDEEDITSRAQWDPKIGFLIRNLAIQDSGSYTCRSPSQTKIILVQVKPSTTTLKQPNVYAGSGQHFLVSYAFTLNCSLIKGKVEAALHWTYPNTDAMYDTKTSTEDEGEKLISSLIVPRASTKDSGRYTCKATAPLYSPTEHSMNIAVKEKIEAFINITSTDKISVNESDSLKWRAVVVAFPPDPIIVYTDWQGRKLQQTDRIGMEYQPATASSRLWISNVTAHDFGQYTLIASTRDGAVTENATVMIEVKSAPSVQVSGVPSYLPPGTAQHVTCKTQGFPVASLVWQFQSCPNGPPSCSNLESAVSVEDVTYPAPGNLVEGRASLRVSYPGFLRCQANNSLNASHQTVPLTFSDIDGLFVLRHTGLNKTTEATTTTTLTIVTNDDFRLFCGANKLHYRSVKMVAPPRSGVVVGSSESQFSMKQEATVARVTLALEGTYSCSSQPYGTGQEAPVKAVTVTVLKEAPVKFLEDANIARNETVPVKDNASFFINCTVTGTPAPNITWKFDDQPFSHDFLDGKTTILSDDLQRLQLMYVLEDKHMGVYTCSAENRINRATGTLTLTVAVPRLNKAARIGLAAALIGLVVLAAVVVFLMKRIKTERKFRKSFRQNELWLFEKGNVGQLNPDCPADEQAELLPYGEEWEVPRERIEVGKQLGSGAFGRVVKASVTGLEGPAATTVAIKMCKSQADASQVRALTLELKIMIHLGKHLNIVNLMGANTTHINRGELWILVEYCRFGNLLVFMHRHRRNFINQIDPATGRIDHLKLTPDHASLTHPLSPGGSGWWQTSSGSYQDGAAATPGTPLILSSPPPGHTRPPPPHQDTPKRNQVHNPLYNAEVMSPLREGHFFAPHSTVNTENSVNVAPEGYASDGVETNLSSSGSEGRTPNTYMTSSLGSRVPLSPTESGLGDAALTDSHGNPFVHEVGSVPGVNAPFSTSDLICWAWQVAQGMDYLASRKVLHGDLAARNLLLSDDNVVKISDFGLSREMYKKDVYMKKGDDLMPIKWISVEAIRDRIFSVQSDVWAFAVTLWEIFSLGSTPYPGIEVNKDFLPLLEAGYRMECPKYANQEIYKLLLGCWEAEPRDRPSFSHAADHLSALMLPDVAGEYLSMNDQYMRMNEERFRQQTDYLNMFTRPDYENMTSRTDDEDLKPHYVNMQEVTAAAAGGGGASASGPVSLLSPEAVGYCNMNTFSPAPPSSSQAHYLPMSSTRGSLIPENDDVFSPCPVEPPRFTFSHDARAPPAALASKESNPFLNTADAEDRVTDTEQSTFIKQDT